MSHIFCSQLSWQAEEEPIGTAASRQIYVFIECPPPWTKEVVTSKAIPDRMKIDALRLAEEVWQAGLLVRFGLIYNPSLARSDRLRVLIFRQPTGLTLGYRKQEFEVSHLNAVVPLVRDCLLGDAAPPATPVETQTRDILICTHGSYDQCCARYGNVFYRQALAAVEELGNTFANEIPGKLAGELAGDRLRIWQCTHFGGHRFAPTAMDFPEGRCYGRLDPSSFVAILTRRGNIQSLKKTYRGWSILPEPAQVLERELMLMAGWDWFDYEVDCRTIDQSEDSRFHRIELTFATPDAQQSCYGADVVEEATKTVSLPVSCGSEEVSKLRKFAVKNLALIAIDSLIKEEIYRYNLSLFPHTR